MAISNLHNNNFVQLYRVGHKYCYKIKYKHTLKKAFISIFKFANIQDSYQQTISHKLYSKCFPLAFTTARSLLEKSLMEARTIFMGIFSHVFINFNFRASILGLGLEQASVIEGIFSNRSIIHLISIRLISIFFLV